MGGYNYREIVDCMLDIYRDYKLLYEMFGDEEYLETMELAIRYLKSVPQNFAQK